MRRSPIALLLVAALTTAAAGGCSSSETTVSATSGADVGTASGERSGTTGTAAATTSTTAPTTTTPPTPTTVPMPTTAPAPALAGEVVDDPDGYWRITAPPGWKAFRAGSAMMLLMGDAGLASPAAIGVRHQHAGSSISLREVVEDYVVDMSRGIDGEPTLHRAEVVDGGGRPYGIVEYDRLTPESVLSRQRAYLFVSGPNGRPGPNDAGHLMVEVALRDPGATTFEAIEPYALTATFLD